MESKIRRARFLYRRSIDADEEFGTVLIVQMEYWISGLIRSRATNSNIDTTNHVEQQSAQHNKYPGD